MHLAPCLELKVYFLLDCSDTWKLGPKLVLETRTPLWFFRHVFFRLRCEFLWFVHHVYVS